MRVSTISPDPETGPALVHLSCPASWDKVSHFSHPLSWNDTIYLTGMSFANLLISFFFLSSYLFFISILHGFVCCLLDEDQL